jgi:hypothetical protein
MNDYFAAVQRSSLLDTADDAGRKDFEASAVELSKKFRSMLQEALELEQLRLQLEVSDMVGKLDDREILGKLPENVRILPSPRKLDAAARAASRLARAKSRARARANGEDVTPAQMTA